MRAPLSESPKSPTIRPAPAPTPAAPRTATEVRLAWNALACTAIASPTFLAFNVPPSATLLNQVAALIGWGAWLTLMLAVAPRWSSLPRARSSAPALQHASGLIALLAGLAVVFASALAAPLWASLPWSLSLSSAGTILAAMLSALAGASLQRNGHGIAAFRAFCVGMVVAGLGSSLIGIFQVFAPQWTDGDWIAHSALPGRAVGNLRQPNHLSSLLLWAVITAVWLGETQVIKRSLAWGASLLFIFVVVLSASRTGAVGTLLLAGWGIVDRRLSPSMRRLLWAAPVAFAVFWVGNAAWADYSHHVFGGETRFSGAGDVSSSRFGIWSNTLTLIRMHPWLGVGFGEFNFAWTLTPFPHRPVAFFDHTHNLVLQLAVELGIPLASVALVLLGWSFFAAFRAARSPGDGNDAAFEAPMLRAAFMVVFMIAVHSMLEYPLWYAYFLLPTAFALGLCLGPRSTTPLSASTATPASQAMLAKPVGGSGTSRTRPLLIASMLLFAAGVYTVYDYLRVVVIFAPPLDAGPLAQRIDAGRRSWFFAHHADYAAATTALDAPTAGAASILTPYRTASHYLLDARLLLAWAKALDAAGEVRKARYVAARLREFHNEQADDFFAECDDPALVGQTAAPFQCTEPLPESRYEDFRGSMVTQSVKGLNSIPPTSRPASPAPEPRR